MSDAGDYDFFATLAAAGADGIAAAAVPPPPALVPPVLPHVPPVLPHVPPVPPVLPHVPEPAPGVLPPLRPGEPGTGEPDWANDLADAIGRLASGATLVTMGRGLASFFDSEALTTSLFAAHRVTLASGQRVTVGLSTGEARADAVELMAAELQQHLERAGAAVALRPATAALHELYGQLAPAQEAGAVPKGPPATQPPQPADAAAVAMESIRALRDAEKAEKEMSTNDITSKLGQLHAALGEYAFLAPTRGDLLHAQQLRKLHTELIKNGLVQSDPTLEPHKLKLMGGDDGVAACKAEKEKDVEAADAHDVLEYRCRCSGLVHSIGLVTIGEPGGAEIYKGAFAIILALGDATHLTTLPRISDAVEGGLRAARRARNKTGGVTLAAAYAMVGDEIRRANDEAGRRKRARDDDAAETPRKAASVSAAAATAGFVTAEMLAKAMEDAVAKAGGGGQHSGGGAAVRSRRMVNMGDGRSRSYAMLPGGNSSCPVKCTRSHDKAAECELNHSDK